jgi:hypothetical protein
MNLIKSLAKDGLKFKKQRKEKLKSQKSETTKEAAKKRWWQKVNMGLNIGSNKEGVSKDKY